MPRPVLRIVLNLSLPLFLAPGSCSPESPEPGPEVIQAAPAASPVGPSSPPQDIPSPVAAGPSSDLIARGDTAFNTGFCVKCHQSGGIGGERAPNLTDDQWVHCDGTLEGILAVIRSGVPKDRLSRPDYPFAMNSAAKMKLSDETVEALAAYVWSLGH